MREAIGLATNAGQGREVALLHNDLGFARWAFQGPQAAIDELGTGIAYTTTRGVAEAAGWSTVCTLGPLFGTGRLDEALALATALPEQLKDHKSLSEVRGVQARIRPSAAGRHTPPTTWTGWIRSIATPELLKSRSSVWEPPPSPAPRTETRTRHHPLPRIR